MDKLLTTGQVADILGVTADRVRRLVQAGELAAVRIGGGSNGPLRFRPRQVEAFITARETRTQPAASKRVSVLDDVRRRHEQPA